MYYNYLFNFEYYTNTSMQAYMHFKIMKLNKNDFLLEVPYAFNNDPDQIHRIYSWLHLSAFDERVIYQTNNLRIYKLDYLSLINFAFIALLIAQKRGYNLI